MGQEGMNTLGCNFGEVPAAFEAAMTSAYKSGAANEKIEEAVKRAYEASGAANGEKNYAIPPDCEGHYRGVWTDLAATGSLAPTSAAFSINGAGVLELKTKRVLVHTQGMTQPREYAALDAYEKAQFYCVVFMDGLERRVHKYPISSIFRIEEPYA